MAGLSLMTRAWWWTPSTAAPGSVPPGTHRRTRNGIENYSTNSKTCVTPNAQRVLSVRSHWHGRDERSGPLKSGCKDGSLGLGREENGFGYDPIFWIPEFQKTMGQLKPEVKNRISHRGLALARLREHLETYE